MRMNTIFASAAVVALAAFGELTSPAPAAAQLANASAATLGLVGNNTATVRGFAAISVNPAGLGMPGSGFSLALLPVQLRSGLDPVTLAELAAVAGTRVSNAVKEEWLTAVTAEGGQSGIVGVDVSEMALTFGNIGLQLSTIVSANLTLPTGIVEALLYGNGGRTGSPSDLTLSGASVDAFAMTTGALSVAIPLSNPTTAMAIGATVKYTVGHGVAVARSAGGSIQSDPIRVEVDFPMAATSENVNGVNNGNGIGVDVGFMMKRDNFSFGASAQNIVNTFAWDETKLAFRPGTALLEQGTSESSFDEISYASAPANIQALITDMKFKPSIQIGAALDLSKDFTLSGDLHNRFSDQGFALSPNFHLGAGAEFRGLKVLHLRGGGAIITDGIQYGGGASLVLGPINLSAAVAAQTGDLNDTVFGQFTLSFGNR